MFELFRNRQEAGKRLASALLKFAGRDETLILGLPKGGVPVAYEVSSMLALPMDILPVCKLCVPSYEGLSMGALAWNQVCVVNYDIVCQLHIPKVTIQQIIEKEQEKLLKLNLSCRNNKPMPDIKEKTVIVVDDGLSTGFTMKAAVSALRQEKAGNVVVAVPVGALGTCNEIKSISDEMVCLHIPEPFYSVKQWYLDFLKVSDDEVRGIMNNVYSEDSRHSTA